MKRLLTAAAALVCAFGSLFAHAQLTNITASSIGMGGVPIANGTVTFTPVNSTGIPIAFATGGGGLNAPTAFSCTVTAGALDEGCQIPDAGLTTPANILYSITITDTATHKTFTLQSVANITGTNWALDHYGPPANTTNVQTIQTAYGTAAPPASCATPSLYIRNSSGGQLYICVAGSFVQVTGGASVTFGTTAGTAAEGNDSRITAALKTQGAYAGGTTYALNDVVTYAGSYYISLVANNLGHTPAVGSTQWGLIRGDAASVVSASIPQKSSLTFQYLLNEGTGTTATDTSGSGADGTIVGATWDGATDLSFSGSSQYVSIPTATSIATKTFLIAAYFNTLASTGGAFAANPSLLCGTVSPMRCFIENSFTKARSQRFFDYKGDHTEATTYVSPGWHIIGLSCGTGKSQIFVDGAEVGGYVSQATNGCGNVTTGNYQIGGSAYATGSWWFGKVAAAWGWSTQLSAGDIAVASDIALKYVVAKGAVFGFPEVPIYTPQVIGSIDSRTAGIGITNPANKWMTAMTLTDATYARTNLAISGEQMMDACAMFNGMYRPYITSTNGPTVMVVWGGVNDNGGVGTTARTIADSIRCVVQKAKSAGALVIVATEISATSGFDAVKDALDPIIRQEAFSWGADDIADLATQPILGADGASANNTYFTGGLHPIDAGEVYVTAIMQDAVNEMIGSTPTNRHTTAATTYQELAGDRFLDLTGTAAQAITLPSCIGYSLQREIVNVGTTAGTVAANGAETLTGSTALAIGARAIFLPIPGDPATGGCSWRRIQ